IQDRVEPLPQRDRPAVTGVSSFGFGGTNAHLVLGAAPQREEVRDADAGEVLELVPLSARSDAALMHRAAEWAEAARAHGAEAGWTARAAAAAALRGDHYEHRAAVVAADGAELSAGMAALANGEPAPGLAGPRRAARRRPRLVLVFPGQGSQWPGMGRRLAASTPAFRDA